MDNMPYPALGTRPSDSGILHSKKYHQCLVFVSFVALCVYLTNKVTIFLKGLIFFITIFLKGRQHLLWFVLNVFFRK